MPYEPYVIETAEMTALSAPEYRSFLRTNVLAAGIGLLLDRRNHNPDYPFPDTKFNPNDGKDYPPSQYEVLFTWFLGRGSEACTRHLEVLDSLEALSSRRSEARRMLEGYVRSQNEAIVGILDANAGRIPFRVDRRLRGIDAEGRAVSLPPGGCNASELFCAKALIAAGKQGEAETGRRLFRRFVEAAFANGYEDDTAGYDRRFHAESPFMLSLAAFDYLARDGLEEWKELCARILDYTLDRFWEPQSARFFELVDFATGEKRPEFLPGHACELVGLGLQALSALEHGGAEAPSGRRGGFPGALERARRELPRILITAYEQGYDHTHGGIYQSVEPRSGRVLNSDLPWWSLPEAMRAAAHLIASTQEPQLRRRGREILATASNDYFAHYPNPGMKLFPFRTRSGETGAVKNLMPVVPEADPLYHTNLAIIDLLSVLGRLSA